MITPRFSCSQTEKSVTITIYCPSVRASDVEIHVDETLFTAHINPYFLRLNFSGRLLEDNESSALYDPASGYLTVTLTKERRGEEFADLDLLAKLLAPRTLAQSKPVIEVVGGDDIHNRTNAEGSSYQNWEILEAAQNDWQLPQSIPGPLPPLHLSREKQYGFLNMHSGFFTHVAHTENEVNELGSDAETLPIDERRRRRSQSEDKKWDEEHYMADFADASCIQELLTWDHPHVAVVGDDFQFTDDEKMTMLRLPRKEYLATSMETHALYLTLVTLLFSYAYDARTTQHEPTSESAWTISILTPAFSALDPPPYDAPLRPNGAMSELAAALIPSYRRSLAFPLHRSFALAEACHMDVARLLQKGKRTVVRCLLEVKHILDHHEVYYVYTKVWVDDFCSWTQTWARDELLRDLGKALLCTKVDKDSIGWDLRQLEDAVNAAPIHVPDSDDE